MSNTVHFFDLNITRDWIDPDCSGYSAPVLVVNHQMPGPTIRVKRGDRVHITVRNLLWDEPTISPNATHPGAGLNAVSIHFHGIRQYGSIQADGVPGLTQPVIPPGAEFIHEFRVVNQAGTYFYHAHVGLQEQSVFGPFIVDEEVSENNHEIRRAGPYTYDDERTLSLSEWWRRDRTEFEDYLLSPQFNYIPEADSVLINGRGIMDPTRPVPTTCQGYPLVDVDPGKTYRLRVIAAATFRTFGFGIDGHNMTIIEVDGELIEPYETSFLEVAPGQRFSVLLHTHHHHVGRDLTIGTYRRWAEGIDTSSNGLAVLRYSGERDTPIFYAPERPMFPTDLSPHWIWNDLKPLYGVDPVARADDARVVKLRSTDQALPDGRVRWFINGVSFSDPEVPLLHQLRAGKRRRPMYGQLQNGYDPFLGTYPLTYYETVDFVLQATHVPGEPCRTHPWHTHGHSHWEIAYGAGEYDEARDGDLRNVPHPIQKDITLIYPQIDPALEVANGTLRKEVVGCGWSKIRILADNPGYWAMHCHNTPHMLMGMMLALEEAPELIQ
ncbi:Cupredoxin [Syncephalastrum racemosum]|uniref:Cupredoxin n=1 Tax=Syncephalastrum racemosum TaxID=13706 RepID=A0A1X2HIL3_SYNRA|nr:Cupredoxin [Syncephalastrum racemosum]